MSGTHHDFLHVDVVRSRLARLHLRLSVWKRGLSRGGRTASQALAALVATTRANLIRARETKRRRKLQPSATRRLFNRFHGYIARERAPLILAAALMVGTAIAEVLRPWPIKIIFDGMLIPSMSKDATTRLVTDVLGAGELLLAVTTGSVLLLAIVSGVFAYGQTVILASVGRRVVTAIRYDLYKHIQCLSQSFHDSASAGDLLTRLTGDVRMVRDLLVTSVIYMAGRALVLTATLLLMTIMDWRLTLVAAVILPILIASTSFFSNRLKQAARRQRKTESKVTHVMAENLNSIRVIQAHAREEFEGDRFQRENTSSAEGELQATRLEASQSRVVEVLLALGTCAVLWYGVSRVRAGALSPGDLLVFTAYLSGLYKPVRKLATMTSRLAKATACGERVLAILDLEPDIVDRSGAITGAPIRGAIAFDAVAFGYDRNQLVLSDANLQIAPGETIALVSASGSGKTTIAHLLLRFYEPSAGTIRIDGRDIRDYRLSELREQVTVLLQEAVLFNASIRDNIAYGRLDATDDDIVAAARAARAHDFIDALPDGYDTVLGRRGVTLSGGQRQRIAIARAIIRRSPIIILDEPGTGLDGDNEAAVMAGIRELTAGKTCIIITHDASIASMASRIFDVRGGRIVERESIAPLLDTASGTRRADRR